MYFFRSDFATLQSMQEKGLVNYRAALPTDHIYVNTTAVRHVFFCLPLSVVKAAISLTNVNVAALRKEVVIVKIASQPRLNTEYTALLNIQNATGPDADNLRSHFISPLNSSVDTTAETELAHLILPVIVPAITLGNFLDAADETPYPLPFIYHVFLSLGSALRFLHNRLDIEHGDVHEHNIMLRLKVDSPFNLPELVLIDFEQADCSGEMSRDYFDMLVIMDVLISGTEITENAEWKKFREIVVDLSTDKNATTTRKLTVSAFNGLWEKCESVAVKGRSDINTGAGTVLQNIFRDAVAQSRNSVTDEDLIKAVDRVR